MAKIVGFINQKGGVGKSFTTKVVANALSRPKYGKKTIVIDCDEQGTIVAGRKLDIAVQKNKDVEFSYDVATCAAENLLNVVAGEAPVRVLTETGHESQKLDVSVYDYIFVDMPGRGQNRDILTLLASIDYAVVVTLGDTSETMSTMDFFSVIQRAQLLRTQNEIEPIKLALMYNQFKFPTFFTRVNYTELSNGSYNQLSNNSRICKDMSSAQYPLQFIEKHKTHTTDFSNLFVWKH
jgi:cellulose biosynthesis protein BcsQ